MRESAADTGPGSRVAQNAAITYGRYLLGLAFGLFGSRWLLAALGQTDLGLYGVVGSIVASVAFLNTVLSDSVVRFYAVAIGAGDARRLNECFNAAAVLHFVLAAAVLAAGWTAGGWAIERWLDVPDGRASACLFALRATLAASAFTIALSPFSGMFSARQRFGEPAFYSLAASAVTCLTAFLLLRAGGDRLEILAAALSAATVVLTSVAALRAVWRWRADFRPLFDRRAVLARAGEIASYAGWRCVQALGWVVQMQGCAFAVNRFLGADANAAYSVSRQFSTHASSLTDALSAAVSPAIATGAGTGDISRTAGMALSSCRFMSVLAVLVGVPLACEAENVLRLWLVNPPDGASALALFFAVAMMIESATAGIAAALAAQPKIAAWQSLSCAVLVAASAGVWTCLWSGLPLASLGAVFAAAACATGAVRLVFAKRLAGVGFAEWLRCVFLPFALLGGLSAAVAFAVRSLVEPGLARLAAVCAAVASVVLPVAWCAVLTDGERRRILDRLRLKGGGA